MEATQKALTPRIRRALGTRSGTLTLAAAAAALAAIVLVAFLSHYKNTVRGGTAPETVLVAQSLIPKGTAGNAVIDQGLFKPETLTTDQVKDGAIVNTAALAGKVAVRDIYPGSQVVPSDFAAKADPIRGQLSGDQRAIAVPLDAAHGLLGDIRTGDRVDVYAGFNQATSGSGTTHAVLRTVLQNVLVLDVPDGASKANGSSTQTITIRVSDRAAAEIAYAADNGKVWFALRPPAGATQRPATTVDLSSLLAGTAPVSGGN